MKKEIDKLIKEKQYWKNRCKELTEQLDAAQNPAPMLCEECQEVSCECEDDVVDPKQMTLQDVLDEVLPEEMGLSSPEQVDCTECNGEGQIYTDTSSSCMTAPSECCGGCGYDSECEACEGKGTVENE